MDDASGGGSLREIIAGQLAEGYELWESTGIPPLPDKERYLASETSLSVYDGENAASLAVACQSFWLFRKLHGFSEEFPIHATLLGDYFFSVFSKNLIPLDSVELNGVFAKFLAGDTLEPSGIDDYLEFVRGLPAILCIGS